MLPPVVHPTRYNERHHRCEYIVPEIHPSHTKNITHHHYKHMHSYPHTESFADTVSHQHFHCPPGHPPAPRPGFPPRRPFF
ncbi:CotD family spore coat protein [Desertibacillus haloalkaliphilus]|uniref:CotD family spore coat protein n=1 Tax=Desertibacillus haloalkaliphilus TaxID=1328930 RepID=UPI0028AEE9D7|nr:CotD family spore coat protein [Desertibacillus haloalkaliphilus]